MDYWSIPIFLGIVEGLTEFIPVSSTGHLIVSGSLLGFTGDKAVTFEVAIQLGAILAVVVLYWNRFLGLIPRKKNFQHGTRSSLEGWPGIWRITLATIPALILGYLAHDVIKANLFTPVTVAWALAVGGLGILLAEKLASEAPRRSLDTLTLLQAVGIGLFQTLALWPGTSRSAATIVGGLLLGLDRKAAAEFSFLIAVPVMFAASGYEMLKMAGAFTPHDVTQLAVGFAVSFIVALLTVAGFIRFLSRWSLVPFAWYRLAAAPTFYFLTRGLTM
ncbi:MAG: undecaprenyl-diphosphatase [Deltaproteobacteria bacterium RIFCSPLOWO2_02_FULL_57_26]|nr:MAG: undecaprenyl-diphosphatase [Deltaproteobacteria bacterium RIFCSPLOWO2_02_FULL_57_26]